MAVPFAQRCGECESFRNSIWIASNLLQFNENRKRRSALEIGPCVDAVASIYEAPCFIVIPFDLDIVRRIQSIRSCIARFSRRWFCLCGHVYGHDPYNAVIVRISGWNMASRGD